MPLNRPTRRLRMTRAVAVLAALAVATTGCSLFGSDEPAAPTAEERELERGVGVLVAMDGWSQNLLTGPVEWSVGGRTGNVMFEAATQADLDELLELDPGKVTELAARMLTADPRLECTVDGCTAGDTAVPLDGLLDPAAGPYGELLTAAGVDAGLYVAFVPTPGTDPVELRSGADVISVGNIVSTGDGTERPAPPVAPSADGGSGDPSDAGPDPSRVPDVPAGPEATTTTVSQEIPSDDPAFEADDDSAVAAKTTVVAVAAGAGRFFAPGAPWLTGEASEGPNPFGTVGFGVTVAPYAVPAPAAPEGDGPFAAGLKGVDPAVSAGLTVTQLSALTAPTAGCGVAVLCSPDESAATIEQLSVHADRVCDSTIMTAFVPEEADGRPVPGPVELLLVARSAKWTISDAAPLNQFGFWANDPEAPNLMFWPEPAPLTEGSETRYVRSIELYDGEGRILDISGEVTDADAAWDIDAVLAQYGDRFERCGAPQGGVPQQEVIIDDVLPAL